VGLDDDGIVAAALLHDVVEHSEVRLDDVYGRFGDEIGRLVEAMTQPEGVEPYERCKDLHREQVEAAGSRAVAIYVADKLAKVREVRELYARVGERASDSLKAPLDVRMRLWEDDLAMARRVTPQLALVASLEAELAALAGQREAAR
jgi:(p)ppGpp synthase/HD superfamily hydrolase